MADETGVSGQHGQHGNASGGADLVEDNGPWFAVFLAGFLFLFLSACAFLVHSLAVTFD